MKKILSVLIIGVLAATMAFAAAGCGEKDSDKDKKTSSKPTTTAAQSTTAPATTKSTQAATGATANGNGQNTGNDAVVNAARAYFGLGADTQVTVLDTVQPTDGSLYYHVQVPMGSGVSDLYIHSSGYPVYLPDAFNSQVLGLNGNDGNSQQSNGSGDNSVESYVENNGGNSQQSYNTGDNQYDGGGNINGPDGAQP